MDIKTKECEICGGQFTTGFSQQKYCKECGKNPAKSRREYAQALSRILVLSGALDTPKEWICGFCGKPFVTYSVRAYCSHLCQESARIQNAKCRICGSYLIESGNKTGRGVCSKECADKLALIKEAERLQRAKDNGDYIPCKWCKKEFVRKNYANEFCCNDCRLSYIANKTRQEMVKPTNYIDPHTIETRKCVHCGQAFTCERYTRQKFCSKQCRINDSKAKQTSQRTEEKPRRATINEKSVHLCLDCKTSQSFCERFTSNFVYSPEGCKMKKVKKNWIVYECPKYTGSASKINA